MQTYNHRNMREVEVYIVFLRYLLVEPNLEPMICDMQSIEIPEWML